VRGAEGVRGERLPHRCEGGWWEGDALCGVGLSVSREPLGDGVEEGGRRREAEKWGIGNGGGRYIRIAPHEHVAIHAVWPAAGAPVAHAGGRGHQRVGDEEARVPEQDERAGEVAADLDGPCARRPAVLAGDVEVGAGGAFDEDACGAGGEVGLAEPCAVVGGEVDGAGEDGGPEEVRGVEVRVGDDDCGEAAEGVDGGGGGGVEEGDAVPEDVAGGGADEEAALADGDLGGGEDGEEGGGGGVRGEGVGVGRPEGLQGCPGLAGWRHVLARWEVVNG